MEPTVLHSNGEKEEPKAQSLNGEKEEPKVSPSDGKTQKVEKSQPTQKIQAHKIGNKDTTGHMITDVLVSGNEFVIYEIETDDINKKLTFFIDGFDDEREEKIIKDYCEVKSKYITAKGLLYRSPNFGIMKNRVAHSLATAMLGDPAKANEQFTQLISDINSEYEQANRSRLLYIAPGYVLLTLFTFIFGFNSLIKMTQYNEGLKEIFEWMSYSYASIIGGVFSITLSLPNIKFDTEIRGRMFFLYGIERISISVLAGIICVCGIKAKLILSSIFNDQNSYWALFFVVIIAAFSEKMIPNILGKLSDKEK